jgi:hypothetical protein
MLASPQPGRRRSVERAPGAGGAAPDPQTERLSAIIERLNERHALNLTITDALLFEQFKGDWVADPELVAQAKANTLDNFLIVFVNKFLTTVLSRMDANADIFKAINEDKGFAEDLKAGPVLTRSSTAPTRRPDAAERGPHARAGEGASGHCPREGRARGRALRRKRSRTRRGAQAAREPRLGCPEHGEPARSAA